MRTRVAWLAATASFVVLVVGGVYLSDAVRTSDGDRPPVLALVAFSLVVSWLMKRYFSQPHRGKE